MASQLGDGVDERAHGIDSDPELDVYQGVTWTERVARGGTFGAALDPADAQGLRNRYIDAVHRRVLRQALAAAVRQRGAPFARALDFGCGGGRMLNELIRFSAEVYGIDRTPVMIERARAAGLVPDDHLVCWRGGPPPFAGRPFDLFICVYVALSVPMLLAVAEVVPRLCAPGAIGLLLEQVDHGRGLTVEHYRSALDEAGFELEEVRAVRRGSRSPFMRLATLRDWPRPVVGWLAAAEAWAMSRHHHAPRERYYCDHLLVVTRRQQDVTGGSS